MRSYHLLCLWKNIYVTTSGNFNTALVFMMDPLGVDRVIFIGTTAS